MCLVRRLRTRKQLIALLYGRFSGVTSLRETVGSLHSPRTRLHHVGSRTVQRSILADVNAKRPPALFAGAGQGLHRKIGEATWLIGATSLHLSGRDRNGPIFRPGPATPSSL